MIQMGDTQFVTLLDEGWRQKVFSVDMSPQTEIKSGDMVLFNLGGGKMNAAVLRYGLKNTGHMWVEVECPALGQKCISEDRADIFNLFGAIVGKIIAVE